MRSVWQIFIVHIYCLLIKLSPVSIYDICNFICILKMVFDAMNNWWSLINVSEWDANISISFTGAIMYVWARVNRAWIFNTTADIMNSIPICVHTLLTFDEINFLLNKQFKSTKSTRHFLKHNFDTFVHARKFMKERNINHIHRMNEDIIFYRLVSCICVYLVQS